MSPLDWQNLGILAFFLLLAAVGQSLARRLIQLGGNGNGKNNGYVLGFLNGKAMSLIEVATKTEVLIIIGAVFMWVSFTRSGGAQEVINSVSHHIDMHAAILVGTLMFTSLQLKRFVNHMVAFLQHLAGGDERKFSAMVMILVGGLASVISEVAAAAASTGGFAQVNANQTEETKKKLGVLHGVGIGVGGGLTNFAAPSIVIAAGMFGWTTWDTLRYLGPIVLASLLVTGWWAYKTADNCENSPKIETKPFWAIDWVNLVLWAGVLYFGVFADMLGGEKSILGMIVVFAVCFPINFLHALRPEVRKTQPGQKNPVTHVFGEAIESGLVSGFLIALMFMGGMCYMAIQAFGTMLPPQRAFRAISEYATTHGFSAFADNALAVFELGKEAITQNDLLQQISVAWASLTGGVHTIIGTASNIVIVVIMGKHGTKISFFDWMRHAFGIGIVLMLMGMAYVSILSHIL